MEFQPLAKFSAQI